MLKEDQKTPCLKKKFVCNTMEFQELHKDNMSRKNVQKQDRASQGNTWK